MSKRLTTKLPVSKEIRQILCSHLPQKFRVKWVVFVIAILYGMVHGCDFHTKINETTESMIEEVLDQPFESIC